MRTNLSLFDEERTMVTMSLGDHIEELRHRLIRALFGLFAGMILTLIPPLSLGRLVVNQLQEPARRTLVAFHAEQASKERRMPAVQRLTLPCPHEYRRQHLLMPSGKCSPTCPLLEKAH